MSQNTLSYRRQTDPLRVSFGPSALRFDVPEGFFEKGGPGFKASSFMVVNATKSWVRLKGSRDDKDGGYKPVTATTGWLFPPGHVGVYSTQFPKYMSAMSVERQDLPAGEGEIEISYGVGT